MKHGVIVVSLLILTLCLTGIVTAADNSTVIDKDNQLSITQEENQMQSIANDVSIENTKSLSSVNSVSEESIMALSLNGELIENDYDSYDENIEGTQKEDLLEKDVQFDIIEEEVSQFDMDLDKDLNVKVQKIELDYKDDYQLSYELTNFANKYLDLTSSKDIFVITTFKSSKINNKTAKNILNGIINASNGYVHYGNGNLLTLYSINTDLKIAYFIKKDESISLLYYNNGFLLYSGDVGLNGLISEFNVTDEEFSTYSTVLNSWTTTDSRPLLSGVLCDESEIQIYSQEIEFNLLLENTKNILGDSIDSSNNAFIWNKAINSDENAYEGVGMVNGDLTELNLIGANGTQEVVQTPMSQGQLEQIGIDASKKALNYFKSKGINIQKGYPYLYILTSAGYVKVNDSSTSFVLDGISNTTGAILFDNLLAVHTPLWEDLVFYFLWVDSTNSKRYLSYAFVYDALTNNFIVSSDVKKQGDDFAYDLDLYELSDDDDDHNKKKSPKKHTKKNKKNSKSGNTKKISKSTTTKTYYSPSYKAATLVENTFFNTTSNSTNVLNKTNNNNNNTTNATATSPDVSSILAQLQFNPYSAVYVLLAIGLICMVFSVGYLRN